jgi:hypothetical protein
MESLTYFGISMENFGVFQLNFVNLRSFHCGIPVEFSRRENLSFNPWFCRICKTMLPIVCTQKYILVF